MNEPDFEAAHSEHVREMAEHAELIRRYQQRWRYLRAMLWLDGSLFALALLALLLGLLEVLPLAVAACVILPSAVVAWTSYGAVQWRLRRPDLRIDRPR